MSHPTWVRGLKFLGSGSFDVYSKVAPHVGAWIEISIIRFPCLLPVSHPTWVRGLK